MSAVPGAVAGRVDRRDGQSCVRCGMSLSVVAGSRHHRQRRREGQHAASNLILLCGSGTTGCHGWVHAHPFEAQEAGWIVRANGVLKPQEVPLRVCTAPGVYVWMRLDDEGYRYPLSARQVIELVASKGF